jgi:pimeloyl-ACP methyl ester carboxylesterase
VATAILDGVTTRYEVLGDGPPLLMFSPGGFDATIEKWKTQGVYARIKLLDHLPRHYTCIVFDRRETGESGGRVERITWGHYAAQGKGLLDHLRIDHAHIMGACMGCCAAAAFAVAHPDRTRSLVLYWPVGGARYRMQGHARFAEHQAYVRQHGLGGVVALAQSGDKSFGGDPRGGPWVSVIRSDRAFAEDYARFDADRYMLLLTVMARTLFDRDTAPGAEPEDLLRLDVPALIVPGKDHAHAVSAARYLEESLRRAEYWDVAADAQTESNAPARLLEFLQSASVTR